MEATPDIGRFPAFLLGPYCPINEPSSANSPVTKEPGKTTWKKEPTIEFGSVHYLFLDQFAMYMRKTTGKINWASVGSNEGSESWRAVVSFLAVLADKRAVFVHAFYKVSNKNGNANWKKRLVQIKWEIMLRNPVFPFQLKKIGGLKQNTGTCVRKRNESNTTTEKNHFFSDRRKFTIDFYFFLFVSLNIDLCKIVLGMMRLMSSFQVHWDLNSYLFISNRPIYS